MINNDVIDNINRGCPVISYWDDHINNIRDHRVAQLVDQMIDYLGSALGNDYIRYSVDRFHWVDGHKCENMTELHVLMPVSLQGDGHRLYDRLIHINKGTFIREDQNDHVQWIVNERGFKITVSVWFETRQIIVTIQDFTNDKQ